MGDGLGPFARGLLDHQIHHLRRRSITRENLAVVNRFSDHAVERCNRVGRIDDLTDFIRNNQIGGVFK